MSLNFQKTIEYWAIARSIRLKKAPPFLHRQSPDGAEMLVWFYETVIAFAETLSRKKLLAGRNRVRSGAELYPTDTLHCSTSCVNDLAVYWQYETDLADCDDEFYFDFFDAVVSNLKSLLEHMCSGDLKMLMRGALDMQDTFERFVLQNLSEDVHLSAFPLFVDDATPDKVTQLLQIS